MCGRFTISKNIKSIEEYFDVLIDAEKFSQSFNAAPSQMLPVITNKEPNRLNYFRWGLIPSWAKDESIGNKMINARAETIREKPSFKKPLKEKRCIIPADGFYEWKQSKTGKQPYRIILKNNSLFSFAGLWDKWQNQDKKEIFSFTIITTYPNELMKTIHHRMPVILNKEKHNLWLSDTTDTEALCEILTPYPADEMEAYPVSKGVNNPVNNSFDLILPFNK